MLQWIYHKNPRVIDLYDDEFTPTLIIEAKTIKKKRVIDDSDDP